MSVLAQLARARLWCLLYMLAPLPLMWTPLWDWPVPDWTLLTLVVLLFAGAFWAGALAMALALRPAARAMDARLAAAGLVPDRGLAIPLMLIVVVLANLVTLAARASGSLAACAGNLLACTNEAYAAYVEGTGTGSPVEYARIAISPVLYGAIGLSIWNLLAHGRADRAWPFYAAALASEALLALGTGTSRNLANLVLFAIFARAVLGAVRARRRRTSPWTWLLLAVLAVGFFLYFAATQLSRDGFVALAGLQRFGSTYIESLSWRTGSDSFLLKGVESVARYLCQGYFVLGLALGMEGGATFPFGHSMFLARRADLAMGGDYYREMSLPGRIESATGWDYLQSWHSIFPWLMSDLGVAGTALAMVVFGALAMLALAIALTRNDALSKLPLFLMFLLVIYVPANNQLAQAPETYAAFWAAVLLMAVRLVGMLAPRRAAAGGPAAVAA
jgi:hypothetical protein